ncbi:MAG: macro domain-containing protein [Anaerolineae bacterium]|nr:macro domain-containing protein [Anaerolineae bacterium]MDW8102987.1 macro domain-containing protein [Anaerolineae bacterium]
MSEIVILKGDITAIEADAIVNAANNRLWMGSGVAGAIKRVGGEEIEREAVAKGPINVGEAVATGAGRLKARYVIHAAAMGYDDQGQMIPPSHESIRNATLNSLLLAEKLGLKSIAFPALGTGVGGFPLKEAAGIMLKAVRAHLAGGSGLERVIFVLFGDEAYQAFKEAFEEVSEG